MKNYFSGTFEIQRRMDKLKERIAELRARQTGAGSAVPGRVGQTGRNIRAGEDITVEIMDMEREWAGAAIELTRLESEIHRASDALDSPVWRAVVVWRYICRLRWKDVAERAGMSEMQVMRVHNAALKQLSVINANHGSNNRRHCESGAQSLFVALSETKGLPLGMKDPSLRSG